MSAPKTKRGPVVVIAVLLAIAGAYQLLKSALHAPVTPPPAPVVPDASAPKPEPVRATAQRALHPAFAEPNYEAMRKAVLAAAAVEGAAWTEHEQSAERWLQLFAFSDVVEDVARASKQLLDRTATQPGDAADPSGLRAALFVALRQQKPALEALDKCEALPVQPPELKARVARLRGRIALERGEYEKAKAAFETSLQHERSFDALVTLGQLLWRAGDEKAGEKQLELTARTALGQTAAGRAHLEVLRGELKASVGREAAALAHFNAAAAAFPGWWRPRLQAAQLRRAMGQTEKAEAQLRDLVVPSAPRADVLTALARALRDQKREDEATKVLEQAHQLWGADIRRFAELRWPPVANYFLMIDPDAKRALKLAKDNHLMAPGVPGKLLLSRAMLRAGKKGSARLLLEAALKMPWREIRVHALLAEIYESTGDTARAQEQRAAIAELRGG